MGSHLHLSQNSSFKVEFKKLYEKYFKSQIYLISKEEYYSRSLVGLVATKSHACYLLGGTGWDWIRIPLGLNFNGSAGGVSGHT